jgi:hypothetical protein
MFDLVILDERFIAEAGKSPRDFLRQDGKRLKQQRTAAE